MDRCHTIGSANRVTDMAARAEMRITPRIVGSFGMRWFGMDAVIGGTRTLQEERVGGVRWRP